MGAVTCSVRMPSIHVIQQGECRGQIHVLILLLTSCLQPLPPLAGPKQKLEGKGTSYVVHKGQPPM